jgi:hypothetical protein
MVLRRHDRTKRGALPLSSPCGVCCLHAGRLIRKQLLEPGGAEIPLTLLSNTLGSSAPEVMVRHHGGWSPSPAPLLAGIAAGNGRGR